MICAMAHAVMAKLLTAKIIMPAVLGMLKQIPVNTSAYRKPKSNDKAVGVGVMLTKSAHSDKA